MIDPKSLMTAQQVADRLGSHVNYVYTLIRTGKLEAYQIKKGYGVSEEAFQEYLKSTKVEVK
jgi:excisionase family DNA binding protein